MRRQAAVMSRLDLGIEAVYASPLARAQETARIVSEGLRVASVVRTIGALGPGSRVPSLAPIGGTEKGILIVGHAPDMGIMTAALSGLEGPVPFARGGLACIELGTWPIAPPGRLVFVLPPEILLALA